MTRPLFGGALFFETEWVGCYNQNNQTKGNTMAQNIYEVVVVPLQDDSTIELKPASIKLLKAGNRELERLQGVKDTEETLDVLLNTCVVLLKKQRPDLEGPEGRELAEDLFDLETVYKVIEVMLGVKLNDPKLVEAAMRAASAAA
jgi:hypothetical protein